MTDPYKATKPSVAPSTKLSGINYGRVEPSPRLQRVLGMLEDGRPHTTRGIQKRARVCAVGSCVSELRSNGYNIVCKLKATMDDGSRVYSYTLIGG